MEEFTPLLRSSSRSSIDSGETRNIPPEYDVCFVFATEEKTKGFSEDAKLVLKALHSAELEFTQYFSVHEDEIYLLVKVGEEKLRKFADAIDFKLLLDEYQALRAARAGAVGILPFNITHGSEVTNFRPFQHIYAEYSSDPSIQKLYYKNPREKSLFVDLIRLKLIISIIEAPAFKGGAHLSINKLIDKKTLLGFFPLHDNSKIELLKDKWLNLYATPNQQPFDDIKNYFGEKIGLYFKFLAHYASWLAAPAVVGIVCQLVVITTMNFSHPILFAFCLFMAMWSICMLEYWKREEKYTSLTWGMVSFEDEEVDRPQFTGQQIESYIDGAKMAYFSPKTYAQRVQQSYIVVVSMGLMVLGAVVSIYIMRYYLYLTSFRSYAQITASLINSIQITIFNIVYEIIATKLTDMENHRTDTAYEDSIIIKSYLFQFVNSYSSFFFIAFVAKYLPPPGDDDSVTGECGYEDCMVAVAINLAIIFGTRVTVGNAIELLTPHINALIRSYFASEGVTNKPVSKPEKQYNMEVYDKIKGSVDDYAELAVQFGYMTFFIAALPIATFVALVSNYIEIRTDAFKLLTATRRPLPSGAQDIGTWMAIFQLSASIAVMTNAGMIVFTMSLLDGYSNYGRMWIFVGFQWFCFATQFVIGVMIPDEPLEVEIQRKRTDFIVSKLIMMVPDDNDEPESQSNDSDEVISAHQILYDCPSSVN